MRAVIFSGGGSRGASDCAIYVFIMISLFQNLATAKHPDEFQKRVLGYIYIIININNNKKYVGQTKYPIHRTSGHRNANGNQIIDRAVIKYGPENFMICWLRRCNTQDELNFFESFWILNQNTLVPFGYNCTTGGDGKFYCSQKTRAKISAVHKGKTISDEIKRHFSQLYTGVGNPFYGAKHTDESKKKMSVANSNKIGFWKGKKLSLESVNKMINTKIANGDSVGEKNPSAKLTKIDVSNILHEWKFLQPFYSREDIRKRIFYQCCSKKYNVSESAIKRVVRGVSWKKCV